GPPRRLMRTAASLTTVPPTYQTSLTRPGHDCALTTLAWVGVGGYGDTFFKMKTVFAALFAIARSTLPSPSKSAFASATGPAPTANRTGHRKTPFPSPWQA